METESTKSSLNPSELSAPSSSSASVKTTQALNSARTYLEAISGVVTSRSMTSNCDLSAPNLIRIKRDMMELYKDPPPGILVVQEEQNLKMIHAVITGSLGTPYEGGFFYFVIDCGDDYPIQPPKVKFMTTAGGTVQFNPNLYKNGTVCLSILGTWSGPSWSPVQTLSSLLISIQGLLLNDKPYHNEPGFEQELHPGDCDRYNEIIEHETIRIAVIGMVKNDYKLCIPEQLMDDMKMSFLALYDIYESKLVNKLHLSGQVMQDPFVGSRGLFHPDILLEQLRVLKQKLDPQATIPTPAILDQPLADVK